MYWRFQLLSYVFKVGRLLVAFNGIAYGNIIIFINNRISEIISNRRTRPI